MTEDITNITNNNCDAIMTTGDQSFWLRNPITQELSLQKFYEHYKDRMNNEDIFLAWHVGNILYNNTVAAKLKSEG